MSEELWRNVERQWQMDLLPCRNEKIVHCSKQDQEAVELLEAKTVRVDIDGIQRYATPLLPNKDMSPLHASKEAVMANLRFAL